MVSAYILFLNPLILSGASAGANTGMPSDSVVAATAISTGVATAFMGVVRSSCLLLLRACLHDPDHHGNLRCSGAASCPHVHVVTNDSTAPRLIELSATQVGNYPWVVSVQLGTNTYFVLNVRLIAPECYICPFPSLRCTLSPD